MSEGLDVIVKEIVELKNNLKEQRAVTNEKANMLKELQFQKY